MKPLFILVNILRLWPHLLVLRLHKNSFLVRDDVRRWLECGEDKAQSLTWGFLTIMTFKPEFRNLFYKRIGKAALIIQWLCPKMGTLYIATNKIGSGLYIQHGFATIIAAKSIGRNCWINQQVTIGYSNASDCPTILDNVTISAGAKIIGGVILGNNVRVGANAVVVRNVPDNCTVVGVPARIVKRDGKRVNESL